VAKIKKTRGELLEKKQQLELSIRAKDILNDRLGALIEALSRHVREIYRTRKELHENTLALWRSLSMSLAKDGERLFLASLSPSKNYGVIEKKENVMGIKVRAIELIEEETKGKNVTPSFFAYSELNKKTIKLFQQQLKILVDLATAERVVNKLGQEIQKTRHRFNALDVIQIPALEKEIQEIELYLDSREKEEIFNRFFAIEDQEDDIISS
jgi:V/A-type H+-transporting ATPase subunit D